MYYCLDTLFNGGVDNKGDVTICCQDDQKILSHSFVLLSCSQLYKTLNDDFKTGIVSHQGNDKFTITLDLSNFSKDNVIDVVSQMYAYNTVSWSANKTLVEYLQYIQIFYELVEYLLPTENFLKAIDKIFKQQNTKINSIINYGISVPDSEEEESDGEDDTHRIDKLGRLMEFFITCANNNNKYICDIRNNVYKNNESDVKNLYMIDKIYTKTMMPIQSCTETTIFIGYDKFIQDKIMANKNSGGKKCAAKKACGKACAKKPAAKKWAQKKPVCESSSSEQVISSTDSDSY